MEARASAKYLRGSSQKARLVIDMIRGKNVNQALAILRFANKRAANGIEKCMQSAIANANEAAEKANIAVDPDELWLKAAFVDRGPTKNRRRIRPAPQGRAFRQQRHFCHVTILLSSEKPGEKTESEGKSQPALSRRAKRGGAATKEERGLVTDLRFEIPNSDYGLQIPKRRIKWAKKFIHTVFASATTKTGIRTGLRRSSSATF